MIKRKPLQTLIRICGTLLIVAAITYAYFFIFNEANSTTIAMTFLLATLGIATAWGLLEAIIASVAGAGCFNFFFFSPLFFFFFFCPPNLGGLFVFFLSSLVACSKFPTLQQPALL